MSSSTISDIEFKRILSEAKKVLTFTGAGVSVASGLPAFRGDAGWFTAIKKTYHVGNGVDLLNYDQVFKPFLNSLRYETKPSLAKLEAFYAFAGDFRLKMLATRPSRFHKWLGRMARDRKLLAAVTTNIDDLEHHGKVPDHLIVQMHGSMSQLVCEACGTTTEFTGEIAKSCASGQVPYHLTCARVKGTRTRPTKALPTNIFRPHVLLYGNDPLNGTLFSPADFPKIASGTLLLIAGASLPTPEIRRFVKSLVKSIQEQDGVVVVANKKRNSAKLGNDILQWRGDLDHLPIPSASRSRSRSRSRVKTKRSRARSAISVRSKSPSIIYVRSRSPA